MIRNYFTYLKNVYSKIRFSSLILVLTVSFQLLSSCTQKTASINSTQALDRLTSELKLHSSASGADSPIILMAWINSSIADDGSITPTSAENSLQVLVGECGFRDSIIEAVLGKLGYQTRRVNFFDVPIQIGHTATEVYLNGKWAFIDGETGSYYSTVADPKSPLSIPEIRNLWPNVQLMMTNGSVWQKKWVNMEDIANAYANGSLFSVYSSNTLNNPLEPGTTIFYFYETYVTSKYSDADHPDVKFPIGVNLDNLGNYRLGSVDGNSTDLVGEEHLSGANKFYQPILWALGSAVSDNGITNVSDQFNFSSSSNGSKVLEINFIENLSSSEKSQLYVTGTSTGGAPNPVVTWSGNSAFISFSQFSPSTSIEIYLSSGSKTVLHIDSIAWH